MFITFEGIDGCGKSTQAKMLYNHISKTHAALLTREPGGWLGGEQLRSMVLSGELQHGASEAFLFMLDRCEHVAQVIAPAVSRGETVICERYCDSTIAYQCCGRGMPRGFFEGAVEFAKLPAPDITFLFDIDSRAAFERVGKRGKYDSFEQEGIAFMERIRQGYLEIAAANPERVVIVKCGTKNAEEIFSEVVCIMQSKGLSL